LRTNHDVLQIKMDVGERAQQLLVELGGPGLSVPVTALLTTVYTQSSVSVDIKPGIS
jgi:hypothetical protein